MKRAMVLLAGFTVLVSSAAAGAACRGGQLQESVEVAPGELSLADLLPPGSCHELYQAAAQVSLGAAPRAGSERVLEGAEIRRRLERLEDPEMNTREIRYVVPARIVVRLAGTRMACASVAQFLAGVVRNLGSDPGWQNDLHCGGAGNVPAGAALALTKTGWNPLLRRWEFTLRCEGAGGCAPFLAWSDPSHDGGNFSSPAPRIQPEDTVVKRGETAMLTWDQRGIRVVLPVMCLEAGAIGQSIRVRLENAGRTLRAEVVGARALQVGL